MIKKSCEQCGKTMTCHPQRRFCPKCQTAKSKVNQKKQTARHKEAGNGTKHGCAKLTAAQRANRRRGCIDVGEAYGSFVTTGGSSRAGMSI